MTFKGDPGRGGPVEPALVGKGPTVYAQRNQSKNPSGKVQTGTGIAQEVRIRSKKGSGDVEKRFQKLAVALVVALLASASAPPVCRAEEDIPRADVLVIVRPLQNEGEEFRQVVTEAARNAIESRGLVMSLPGSLPPARTAAVDLARGSKTPVALECAYTVKGRELAISIGWYDAATGALAAHGEGRGAVDLQLDRVITDVLASVLASVDGQVQQLRSAREKAAAVGSSNAAATQTVAPQQATTVVPDAGAGGLFRTIAPTRLFLSASFAPFIATGAASYYFTLGYLPSILADLIFTTASGRIGVGLSLGVDFFSAIGSNDTSDNYLLPLGIDLRYEFAQPRFVLFFHLAGGPAALLILTGSRQTFVNVVPFVRSGIGAELSLSSLVGIGVTADYEIYFVMPYYLMGFAPAVNVTFRL
jgi:hypothetical protein